MALDLNDLVSTYSVPDEPLDVTLPGGEVLRFARPRSAADLRARREAASLWMKTARVHVQGDDRETVGALEETPEILSQAVMLADACLSFDDVTANDKRYKFCQLAHKCSLIFDLIWNTYAFGLVGNYVRQVQEAQDEGKPDCASLAPIESDSKLQETSGENTPTS